MVIKKSWLVMALLTTVVLAQEESSEIKISAWGSYSIGRVGSGFSQKNYSPKDSTKWFLAGEPDIDFSKRVLSDFQGGVKLEKKFSEYTSARLHFGFTTVFQILNDAASGSGANIEYSRRKFAAYLVDAGVDHIIELDDLGKLRLEGGYIPTRYNPQAANLGEYLFRSTAYPTTIESGFEMADKEKVAGIHAEYTMDYGEKSKIKADAFVFTGMKYVPLYDISPALLFSVNHEQLFELGGGIVFHNLMSVDERQTTPGKNTEMSGRNLMWYIDSLKDTTFYTTRGVKLMGRITLNPKELFVDDDESIFGKEDLKLFAEVAVLGTKNYKPWYDNIKERMPLMFGFNLPGFKVLDVVSLQLQWFGNRYYNSLEAYFKMQQMIPYTGKGTMIPTFEEFDSIPGWQVKDDDWKWSLYMSKTLNKRVKFSLQLANDNLLKAGYMPPPPQASKYTEICRRTWDVDPITGKEQWGKIWDWYWMGKITFFI